MTKHELDTFEYDKPFVRAVCTCSWKTRDCRARDDAEKKLLRHAEGAAKIQAELDAWVEREVAKAPPLSDEQRARLAVLLRPFQ